MEQFDLITNVFAFLVRNKASFLTLSDILAVIASYTVRGDSF